MLCPPLSTSYFSNNTSQIKNYEKFFTAGEMLLCISKKKKSSFFKVRHPYYSWLAGLVIRTNVHVALLLVNVCKLDMFK